MALDPFKNPVHPPIHLHQRMDPIPHNYHNHWCIPPICYIYLLVSIVVGYSRALFLQIWIFWFLRDHIHGSIGNGACDTSIFLLRCFRKCKIINRGLLELLYGGALVNKAVGASGGAVTSSTAMS